MTAARPMPAIRLAAAHAAAIWAFAVAQPLYDVLRRNPEFFIAHRHLLPPAPVDGDLRADRKP